MGEGLQEWTVRMSGLDVQGDPGGTPGSGRGRGGGVCSVDWSWGLLL